ncbi:signal recognition particle-docking protein FtsY [Mesosutterella faecium]
MMAFFFGKKNKDASADAQDEQRSSPEEKSSWFSRHFNKESAREEPAPTPPSPPQEDSAGNSWFSRLKRGLTRTRVNLYGLFSGGKIDEEFLENLQDGLITADAGLPASERIIGELKDAIKLKGLQTQDEVRGELISIIASLLEPCEKPLRLDQASPLVIMMAGVNGAGKTTSIGKIAKWLSGQGKSVLLAAGDTFRAAAREQLEVWGERNNVHVVAQQGADPAAVIFDAIVSARAKHIDVVLADTAGRLPTQTRLMDELVRIKRSQGKALAGAPHEVILVLDGTNGQNALAQVRQFDEAVGLTGLIVTKLDGTAKGGVLLAIAEMRRGRPLPIYFIGVGESIDDLQPFKAEEFARALVGTGQEQ